MTVQPLKIIVVGETFSASRTVQRVRALQRLGHEVNVVSTSGQQETYEIPGIVERVLYRLRIPSDQAQANKALQDAVTPTTDVVWLDNARTIKSSTLRIVRQRAPQVRLVWYCEDDMMNPRHRTRWIESAMPLFDLWVTTKSFNTKSEELPQFGVKKFLFINNTFDPALHHPHNIDSVTRERLGADIAFIGTYESPRANSMLRLAENGFSVRIWGNGWKDWQTRHDLLRIENTAIYNEDYARCISASRINLCFLRRFNRDRQTCRSVEIPACGGFMLHESSTEMESIFKPGQDAAYFRDDNDLVAQCRYWLQNEEKRIKVAASAPGKALEAGLTHDAMLTKALKDVLERSS